MGDELSGMGEVSIWGKGSGMNETYEFVWTNKRVLPVWEQIGEKGGQSSRTV